MQPIVCKSARVIGDQVAVNGKGLLFGVYVRSDGVGVASATLYDNLAAVGEPIATFTAASGLGQVHSLPAPREIMTGIFVDVGSNVSEVVVFYM
jgi:hypothetical protein